VRYVAEFIANLRGISVEALAEATTENFFRLFKGAAR
jgi:TatD DNase family protein